MLRRGCAILLLASFLATASGVALYAHELLEGPKHDPQSCKICQDLLALSNVAAPVVAGMPTPAAVVATLIPPPAEQPTCPALPPAIEPRAPPAGLSSL
jgi:hypothetical protein